MLHIIGINKLTYYLCLAGICLGIILGPGFGYRMRDGPMFMDLAFGIMTLQYRINRRNAHDVVRQFKLT
ncbi:hypothetical protein [Methanospirillum sp.]|uniref:hypothetical protein n=1 Tax=Methanospirillum sp. TaxID=45200 RepID=UPI0035A03EE3